MGKIAANMRVRIWNVDENRTCRKDEPGEVQLCSPNVITHYLDNAKPEAFITDESGSRWFRTGDLGLIDSKDILYVVGRIKDIIKRSGIPITPAALENCIQGYVGSLAVVIGIPSKKLGDEPFAILESLNGKTENEIKQRVLDVFSPDYALAGTVTIKELGLDSFPLNASDKIMRTELEKLAKSYFQR
jgi:acyl-CoA synthetase (AMP-forming)/AMP-acid ligase II